MQIVSHYIESIAEAFWVSPDKKWTPPYDISCAISLSLPLDIVSIPGLSLKKIEQWLHQRNRKISIEVDDRHLHGFILLNKGAGFIFVNGTDSEEERRYTIAHEVSHYLLDYKIPRDRALQKLGPSIQDVLDGVREPSIQERINGLLNDVIVNQYTHFLEKYGDGSFQSNRIFESENNADALALELLAPHLDVIQYSSDKTQKIEFHSFSKSCLDVLLQKYKLPGQIAEHYAKRISYSITEGPSIVGKLGF